jgi:hypothetical protein
MKHQIIGEDDVSYHVHDGKSHFLVAKKGISEDLHKKIRGLPKYAEGGEVEPAKEEDKSFMEKAGVMIGKGARELAPAALSAINPAIVPAMSLYQNREAITKPAEKFGNALMTGAFGEMPPEPGLGTQGPVSDVAMTSAFGDMPQSAYPVPHEQATAQPAQGTTQTMQQPQSGAQASPMPERPDFYGQFQKNQAMQAGAINKTAEIQGNLALQQAKVYEEQQNPELEKQVKQRMMDLEVERKKVGQELDSFRSAGMQDKIDPSRVWNNMSTGNKILATIGMVLGGAGSGGNAANNAGLNVLNQAIDRDIRAQMSDKENKMNLYRLNMDRYKDTLTAQEMTRMQLNSITQGKIAGLAARAGSGLAKAQAQQMIAQLNNQNLSTGQELYQRQASLRTMDALNKSGAATTPAVKVRILGQTGIIPKEELNPVYKELQDAQNLVALRDEGMRVFDEMSKLNTVAGKLNPQTRSKISAIKDAYLDRLTKDTSGRVTPQTVDLVGGVFSGAMDNPQTVEEKRANFNKFLMANSSFPRLDAYQVNPVSNVIYAKPVKGVSAKGK